jgi:neutral ceramidase
MYASAVEIDITPPVGSSMDGYAARSGNSLGIHDPLLGQLLLLEEAEQRVLLISLDLIAVGLDFTQQVREGIAQAIGVPGDCILVACSHTHSGAGGFLPPLPGIPSFQEPELKQMVIRKLVGASIWAQQRLQPARLGVGRGSVAGIGLNRNNPDIRPIDVEVVVLRVEDETGVPLAVLMNYGCHPTVLGHSNRFYSADFPGAARAALRRIYPDTIFLFTNGASGDISTRFTRREQSFEEVERMGRMLAGEVLKVMETIRTHTAAGLSARVKAAELKFRPFPTPEIAAMELARQRAELEVLQASQASHGEIRRAITRVEGATGQASMAAELAGRLANQSQIQMILIGDLGMVGLPGEPFTRTVLEIKAGSPKPFTAVTSYANDYQGYFPDAQAIEEESYEALISPYNAEVADILRDAALDLLRSE